MTDLKTPEEMARVAYPSHIGRSTWRAEVTAYQAGVADDRKAIADRLAFALAHASPFELLRALHADLEGATGEAAPAQTLAEQPEHARMVVR